LILKLLWQAPSSVDTLLGCFVSNETTYRIRTHSL